MSPSSSDRWARLDEALRRYAPSVARSLAPPAPPDKLAALLSAPWCPRSVYETYAAHDGARKAGGLLSRLPAIDGARWSAACRFMPIAEALDERDRLRGFFQQTAALFCPIGRVGRFRMSDPYNAEDQYVLVIDAAADEELLAVCYHEYGGAGPVARLSVRWSSYLDDLTARLASGALAASVDAFGVLRLDDARPRPQAQRRDPAEVLLAALTAQGLVHLAGEPTPALLEGARRALRKRGASARAAALLALFSDLDEVEDYFVTEDELAALLEQL